MATGSLLQPLRDEHRELLPHIQALRSAADLVGESEDVAVRAAVEEAYDFLAGHLIPHATAEDAALYPVVEEAMGAPGATDTMRRDHVEVGRYVKELASLRAEIAGSPVSQARRRDLQRVLYGLSAMVSLHFAKEEEIYIPILEGWLTPEKADRLFESMEAAADAAREAQPA